MKHVLTSQIHPDLPPEIWEIILKRTDPGTCLTFCRSDLISDCDLETTLREMLVAGNLAGIQTLYGRISAAFYKIDSAVREILVAGNLAHFQTLYGTLPATYHGMDTRAIIDLLIFLHNNQHLSGRGGSERAMDVAAENGHLLVVRWLHENWAYGCSALAMNSAATNGHFDVVRWLHENRDDGCSKYAMDFAASNGHLPVVRWLHENRHEGCSKYAMIWAATSGHLKVVRFLHENRNEFQSREVMIEAMNAAGRNDYWLVARWLHENSHENCHEECWKAIGLQDGHSWINKC